MNDQQLKQLLHQADAAIPLTETDAAGLAAAVRRRLVQRRRRHRRATTAAAAAVIAIVCFFGQRQYQLIQKEREIARLEQDIRDLSRRTEQTLAMVQEVLESRQRQDKMQMAGKSIMYSDPVEAEIEQTAFIMVYQADRMMEKYSKKETAVKYYKQVIERFGETSSAQTARQRLAEIENQSSRI